MRCSSHLYSACVDRHVVDCLLECFLQIVSTSDNWRKAWAQTYGADSTPTRVLRHHLMSATDERRSRPVDSSDIEFDSEASEGEHATPNGTPLPRGPPPPHAVQAERPMSFAISSAIAATLASRGIHVRQVLTMVTGSLASMRGVRVDITELQDRLAHDHPNTLLFTDLEDPDDPMTMPNGEQSDEAGLGDQAADRALRDWNEARLTGNIAEAMNREGRTSMTREEASTLTAAMLGDDIDTLAEEVTAAASSTETPHATAIAPHTPPNFTDRNRGGATAKPKTNRKCAPQLFMGAAHLGHNQHLFLLIDCFTQALRIHSGADVVIARHSSVSFGCDFNRGQGRGKNALTFSVTATDSCNAVSTWHQKNANMPGCKQGAVDTTCQIMTRLARYSTWTSSSAPAHSLLCISQTALICILCLTACGPRRFCSQIHQVAVTLQAHHQLITSEQADHTSNVQATSGRTVSAGRIGPKSGGTHKMLGAKFLVWLIWFSLRMQPAVSVCVDARVDADTTAASEAKRHGLLAKHSGTQRTITSKAQMDPTKVGKRSYRRAYARAVRMGGTPYKGHWRPLSWFTPRHIVPQFVGRRPDHERSAKAWRVLSWNAGGLTKEVFQELRTYATMGEYDIVLVQETKWRYDSTWSDRAYHFVHSQGQGKDDQVAGLLTMISTRLTKAEDIQHSALHHGRLLHVRFPRGQVHVDVLNWYQYAVSDAEGVYDKRHKLLTRLQRSVAGLPRRNTLLLGGDFNCPFESNAPCCGDCVLPHNVLHYKDFKDHQNVVDSLHLSVLNSWCRPQHGQLATFTFGKLASQIDYLMMRQQQTTQEARRAQVIANFPVAAWREGANHHPIEAFIQAPRNTRQLHARQEHFTACFHQDLLMQDLRADAPSQALQAMRQEAANSIRNEDDANTVLPQAARKHYPPPPRTSHPPDQPEALANCAKHMWAIFRQMRAQRRTAKGMLTAWQLWVRFQQAHRIHKQRSRRRTKDRRDELLVQAQQAADQGNTYGLWRIVKQLAPKAPRKRLQLHKEGNILSTSEELSWILEAYGERYGANTPATLKIENGQAAPHPIIYAPALAGVLGRLNPRKAVPRGAAPSILWKACCREVAASVVGSINRNWMQSPPRITQGWSDATVALLPKPHGRMNSPLDLRPIGLQDPLGKGVMTLLLQQAREEIITLIRKYPQTAYLPGRGTSTALRQVFRHCHDIREMGLGARLTVHQRQTGARPQQCCGGLQISLDLSAAFDLMRWTHLKQALDLAGTPVYLQDILLTWLIQVRYLFYHRDQEGTVTPDGDFVKAVQLHLYYGPHSPLSFVSRSRTNSDPGGPLRTPPCMRTTTIYDGNS